MSKYIIKNCPCYNNERFLGGFLDDNDTFCTYYDKKCQYCTDCVMKQIADYCLDNEIYGDEYYTRPILERLDIQEVE